MTNTSILPIALLSTILQSLDSRPPTDRRPSARYKMAPFCRRVTESRTASLFLPNTFWKQFEDVFDAEPICKNIRQSGRAPPSERPQRRFQTKTASISMTNIQNCLSNYRLQYYSGWRPSPSARYNSDGLHFVEAFQSLERLRCFFQTLILTKTHLSTCLEAVRRRFRRGAHLQELS